MSVDLTITTDKNYKPNLFDVHKVFDEEVVGEYESRMSLFTQWILGEKNVLMSGPRSSGKTWLSDHIKSLVGDLETDQTGRSYTLSSGSEKSAWYDMENIARADYILVLELNKIPKEAQEVLKDWGEGKQSVYKAVVMEGGVRKIKKMVLPPKPFVFCLADEEELDINPQLQSRLTTIRTDASVSQNKKVLNQQAKLAMEPSNTKNVNINSKNQLKEHIRTLPPIDKYSFKHPASDLFVDCIPSFFTDCRRDFPKYLSNVNGICRFYWKERIIDEKSKFIFITPQDMYLNHIIYSRIMMESSLKVNNIEREMIYILKSRSDFMNRQEIQKELRKRGVNVSASMTTRHLNGLSDVGYLNKQSDPKGKVTVYEAGDFFDEFKFSLNWKEVIKISAKNMQKMYPFIADEYIKLFCENPKVIDPFTGETVNMMELKDEVVEPSKDKLSSFFKSEGDNTNLEAKPKKSEVREEVKVKDIVSSLYQPKDDDKYEVVEEEIVE